MKLDELEILEEKVVRDTLNSLVDRIGIELRNEALRGLKEEDKEITSNSYKTRLDAVTDYFIKKLDTYLLKDKKRIKF